MPIGPGSRLGPYEVTALIGEGGMGKVCRAHHTGLKRDDALKVLPDAFASDPDRLARFRREAQVLASLNHPNIAHVYGLEQSDGVQALVMELVEGPTLADRIAQGPIPVDEALPIAKQIAEALEAAHEQGIIHRDLKPANIKVRPDGTVKVLDFGLAKALEPTGAMSPSVSQSPTITSPAMMTGVGVLLGTAAYMSPEQARGRAVDRRSDIWAFGCVLYEMLTGQRAFAGDEVSDVLASVLAREPDWTVLPRGLSPVVGTFLKRCLHKDRKQRVGDAQSVRLALEGAFETVATQVAHVAVVPQPTWRRPRPIAATAVVAILATGVAVWSLWPTGVPPTVTRFNYSLPPDQQFRNPGRPVMALSRDGRHFIYNTVGGLYLRSMHDLQARPIPGTELISAHPFFSPDGESVGYFEIDSGQLKRVSVSGGSAVVICAATNPFGVSWETDNTILFGQPNGIMRVSANGGTPELVIPAKQGEQVYGPQLLRDGDSVLFSVTTASGLNRWDQAQIVVQSLSTGERTVVLQGGSDARYVPTGHLVYALGEALFAIGFDVGRLEVRGGPVSIVEGVARSGNPALNTGTAHYDVSDTGTLVYVEAGAGGGFRTNASPLSTLVWVDRKGSEESLLALPRRYLYPRLSPDGTRLALDMREQEQDIWTWDVSRRTMTRVTFDAQLDALPVWSPDGRRLVWASQRGGASLNLYSQAADGTGTVERLTESPNIHRATGFTPDGTRLIISEISPESLTDVAMLSLEGDRAVMPLVRTMFNERNGEISPDGRWLAYESNESGEFQIYVRPFPGVDQGRWQLSTDGGRQPLWLRNGRELVYVAPDGALMGVPVHVVQNGPSLAAGTPAKLVAGDTYYYAWNDLNQGRTYDVSPDGQRFVRIRIQEADSETSGGPSKVVIVENWFEELKRLVPTN
jgi:eukaryotic-like serine/threonine-protein kinase